MSKTKSTDAAASTETKVVAPTKPTTLHVIGPVYEALPQAAAHIRNGYRFATLPIAMFSDSNTISFHLELGDPDEFTIKAAQAAAAEALMLQEAQHQRDIEAAAKRMIEEAAIAAKKAELAAEIAEKEKALKALKATLATA